MESKTGADTSGAGRERRARRLFWPILVAALVIVASHRPRLASPGVTHFDKVVHFAVYGLLGTLTVRVGNDRKAAIRALLAVSAFGLADEWHQSFVPGRSAEFADWLADTLGAATAVTLYVGWPWYRRLLERPCLGSGEARAGLAAAER